MQERRLMLLNKERKAEALAELEAEDAEKKREREVAENARRREAATGIYRCHLEMKQPVEAAEAARLRLGMCETEEERRQVTRRNRLVFASTVNCFCGRLCSIPSVSDQTDGRRLRFVEGSFISTPHSFMLTEIVS